MVSARLSLSRFEACFARLQPGDLALVLIDQVEESLAFIERLIAQDAPATSTLPPQRGATSGGASMAARHVASPG